MPAVNASVKPASSFYFARLAGHLAHRAALGTEKLAAYFIKGDQSRPLAHKAHERLFSLFLPKQVMVENLNESQRQAALQIKEDVWEKLASSDQALDVMTGLSLDPFLSGAQHLLDPHKHYMQLLRHVSPQLFFKLRFLYLSSIYGSKLGEELADLVGHSKPKYHPDLENYVAAFQNNKSRFFNPENKLYYDAKTKTLRHQDGDFDYVIVGSGTAGSVLAHELTQAGLRVLVLEEGSFFVPGAADGTRENALYESGNLRLTDNGQAVIRNARVAGGGSSVNVDLAFPPTFANIAARLEKWRLLGAMTYTQTQIENAYAWVEQVFTTRHLDESDLNKNNAKLMQGSAKLGWSASFYRLNRYPEDASPSPSTSKISSLEKLLIPSLLKTQNPALLLTDTKALRIEFTEEGGVRRAAKIHLRQGSPVDSGVVIADPMRLGIPAGEEFSVAVNNLILCAGALGSPALLLRSGAKSFNQQVGESLVIHPSMPVISEFDENIDSSDGLTASVFNAHFASDPEHGYIIEAMDGEPGYVAPMVFEDGKTVFLTIKKYRKFAGFGPMLIDTSNTNTNISIDADGNPVVNYQLSPEDKIRFKKAIATTARIAFASGAKRVMIPSAEITSKEGSQFFESVEDFETALEKLDFKPSLTVVTSAHLQASLSMGSSPATGAVSPEQKLYGVENIFVSDASVFPESIGANPMQSIYTFAKLLAERLIGGATEGKTK